MIGLALLLAAGCGERITLGQEPRPPIPVVRDECGNGLDDDENGLVDDGCVCATSEARSCWPGAVRSDGVGACARGEMRCEIAPSMEWGRWGPCEGAGLAAPERCGGLDEDCDGALDEGCTGCLPGEARACATPPREPPCAAGAQRCLGTGVWSACEGAVPPAREVCENGVDDDCDGEVDDARSCVCLSEPERCGNGRDDDCDGLVDADDVCITCASDTESCEQPLDEDCDGRFDEGCADAGPLG